MARVLAARIRDAAIIAACRSIERSLKVGTVYIEETRLIYGVSL
jgi:hypothetical protein